MTPAWATGLLTPLLPSHAPQRGPRRYPPCGEPPPPGCLPYGWWTLADGSHVLFSRWYCRCGVVRLTALSRRRTQRNGSNGSCRPGSMTTATRHGEIRRRAPGAKRFWRGGGSENESPPLGGGPGGGLEEVTPERHHRRMPMLPLATKDTTTCNIATQPWATPRQT